MTLVVLSETEHRDADYALDPDVVAGMWRMEERHFWHAARNEWIARALAEAGLAPPARVLEVGCGSGAVAGALHARGYEVVGVDTAGVLVRKAHERVPEARFVIGRVEDLGPELTGFDAVGFFDVLEHLDDPAALMRAALARARPGALAIATVPALRSLFSVVDELSGHKRRYELGELAATFREVGLADVVEHGMFRTLAPLLRTWRKPGGAPADAAERRRIMLADSRVPPAPVNAVLRWLCTREARHGFRRARGRVGPSLLVMGRVGG